MRFQTSLAALAAAVGFVNAYDTGSPLNRPTWLNNLDGFEKGLEGLTNTPFTKSQWAAGTIPRNVQQLITNKGAACNTGMNYNPAKMITYNITYNDCSEPWVFSMHQNSGITIDSFALQFGRMPIQMRQWVRHVISVPDTFGHAFNCNGDIVFFRPVDNMMTAIIHETGHSLDLLGAFGGIQLSNSDNWWNNYNQDTHVMDPYGDTDMIEEVAQTTVVSVYNENVSGKVGGLYGNYSVVFHQFATMITQARNNGRGNSIITPGQTGACKHNLVTSPPVPVVPTSGQRRVRAEPEAEVAAHAHSITDCDLTW